MEKTISPKYKTILKLDIIAAGILAIHCVAFILITSQAMFLKDLAQKTVPMYAFTVLLWGILELAVLLVRAHIYASAKDGDGRKQSESDVYQWMMVANIFLPIILLRRQGNILAFVTTAAQYVSTFKIVFFAATLIVPILIAAAAAIIALTAILGLNKKPVE